MPPAIPERWIPYKSCGRVIDGTRIICFKVPLRKAVQVGNPEIKEIWDVKTVLEKIPKLGAVIDLTNTARYYKPKEFEEAGILHKKILMPGRLVPKENIVQEFMDTVDEFLGKDCVAVQVKKIRLGVPTTELLIGVHCTHGLNRTGYMVCRYMRDRLHIPAKDAIKKFEKARGYKIERENYIADLLGDKPLPPDEGKETLVKPIAGNSEYKSPLKEDDEDQNGIRKDRYKKSKRSAVDDKLNYNWRTECRDSETSSRPSTSKKRESFDYKYDY